MDLVTQQNAALVEEMAAAAASLKHLAIEQVRGVSAFGLPQILEDGQLGTRLLGSNIGH